VHTSLRTRVVPRRLYFPTSSRGPRVLPVYDHVVIVVEENKNYEQIIGNTNAPLYQRGSQKRGGDSHENVRRGAPQSRKLLWLFSGSNQKIGFVDAVPQSPIKTSNLGEELIRTGHSFKGYSEGLPEIGSLVNRDGLYARKHCPWISFSNVPNGKTAADSSNLRFPEDFPKDYNALPTVSLVIPNLVNDMHDGNPRSSIPAGDQWLCRHINGYYEWAKQHNSLLILTFDEER